MTAKGLVLIRAQHISLTRRMHRILVARGRWRMLGFAYRFSRVDEALGNVGMIPAAAKVANRLIQANQHYLGTASAPGIPPNLVTVSSIHWR